MSGNLDAIWKFEAVRRLNSHGCVLDASHFDSLTAAKDDPSLLAAYCSMVRQVVDSKRGPDVTYEYESINTLPQFFKSTNIVVFVTRGQKTAVVIENGVVRAQRVVGNFFTDNGRHVAMSWLIDLKPEMIVRDKCTDFSRFSAEVEAFALWAAAGLPVYEVEQMAAHNGASPKITAAAFFAFVARVRQAAHILGPLEGTHQRSAFIRAIVRAIDALVQCGYMDHDMSQKDAEEIRLDVKMLIRPDLFFDLPTSEQ